MVALTGYRQGLQDTLASLLAPIEFFAGRIDTPQENRDVGCVYVTGKREGADVATEEIELVVRVFKQWKLEQGYTQPQVAALESLVEEVQVALRDVQTTMGPWMFRVVQVEVLYELSAVEATVLATQANLHALGG